MSGSRVPKRRLLHGWGGLILVALVLALFVWLDGREKREGQGVGYCPEDAIWIAAAEDFGAFWEGVAETDSMSRLRREWPRPLASWELAVRQLTGVRPTPGRWRLWMGYRALAAESPEGRGLCVYPGLLVRGAHALLRVLSDGGEEGVFRFGDLHYGWRNGFLVISDSGEYVKGALTAPEPVIEQSSGPNELRLHWRVQPEGFLRIRCGEGFPVEGRVHFAVTPRNGPLTLADAWPDATMLAITAAKTADIRAALGLLAEPLREIPGGKYIDRSLRIVWDTWGFDVLPAEWERPVDHCSFAVVDVDSATTLPIPRAALALRCARPPRGMRHPLEGLVRDFTTFPYEWQERSGVLAPLGGERITLCFSRDGLDWLATSEEPLMNELFGAFRQSAAPEADMAIRVDWGKLGGTVERQLIRAGEFDLIPGMDNDDIQHDIVPTIRGLSELGSFVVDARAETEQDWVSFKGFLAKSEAEAVR